MRQFSIAALHNITLHEELSLLIGGKVILHAPNNLTLACEFTL